MCRRIYQKLLNVLFCTKGAIPDLPRPAACDPIPTQMADADKDIGDGTTGPDGVPELPRVAVLGAGSWGTALAIHAARRGWQTQLWSRRADHTQAMRKDRSNERYLPDFAFPQTLTATDDMAEALAKPGLVICAIPSHGMRGAMKQVRAVLDAQPAGTDPMFLIAAKGIEVDTLATMQRVLQDELPPPLRGRIAALGGPSFAKEVAAGKPTTVVVAATNPEVSGPIQRLLSGHSVRAYVTDDVLGVELGGTFKNVIAMAAGIGDGAGLGDNARAGLITRGLAEISRLAVSLGAHPATLSGLAGMGDLVLTCTGGLSRNRRVGIALGQGRTLEDILEEMGMVAEGVKNTKSAHKLAHQQSVEMPLVATMHAILYDGMEVSKAVAALMGRSLKSEREW